MDEATLFSRHVAHLQSETERALEATGYASLVISSGAPFTYFADDQDAPFRATPHFRHWCPLDGPHHLLHVAAGRRPRLVRCAPEDYWYEQGGVTETWWQGAFEYQEAPSVEAAWAALGRPANAAYVGNEGGRAAAAGLADNPASLVARLDWTRSFKDAYEIARIEEATVLGARGHRAARKAFASGASEMEVHQAYLEAVGTTEAALPYPTIVAIDEKAATLHYERKRSERDGRLLLLDAGAAAYGYASDITRTTPSGGCDTRFAALIGRMDALELELASASRPGRPYLDVHLEAHRGVARIATELGILRVSAEEAFDKGLTHPFLPHGVGHHLGVQVHDVAGRQRDASGGTVPPPPQHPFLRNTRTIEPGHVFTIEPGFYFVPMLLRPFRSGEHASAFNWPLIDELTPFGGVRVEDNILVTASGPRNLTREQLPD